jgi:hypothetical protein
MPDAQPDNGKKPFPLTNGDSLAVLNLSGQPGRRELLVKDRYSNFWVYSNRLERLWHGRGQTGHYPYPFDIDGYVANVTGDARDEVILWDQDRVWIYTQDNPTLGDRVYAPVRNPEYNESNYRTVVSRPGWAEGGQKASGR